MLVTLNVTTILVHPICSYTKSPFADAGLKLRVESSSVLRMLKRADMCKYATSYPTLSGTTSCLWACNVSSNRSAGSTERILLRHAKMSGTP